MRRYLPLVFFILTCAVINAQNSAYLIPRIVYVGDPAAMILPLPGYVHDSADIILTNGFPQDNDIDFHRIILERRASGGRLLIEFTAFAPGHLKLPVIEIGGEYFFDLSVTISSVIDSRVSELELSGAAAPLAAPGTSFLIYGTMAGIVLLLLLTLWFALRGRRYLREWIAKWRFSRLFISMRKIERHLYKTLLKGGKTREILDRLSEEFRTFLSYLTENNCRAMTAVELETLPLEQTFKQETNSGFLGKFFRRCDELRFSGETVNGEDITPLLADLRLFLDTVEKTGKSNPGEAA
ncbi:MAG: hypothetical protein LBH44_10360 [Treponema sp.]|jgi:hypothetical protein|nr:hypothetical protein [Treponema sp.]